MSKKKKKKIERFDGLNPVDIERIVKALRKVWSWSYSRKLVILRCTDKNGFGVCEKCRSRCPRVFVDHIKAVGTFNHGGDYITKLFVPSNQMQGLCGPCHKIKTKADMAIIKSKIINDLDFF